MNNDDPFFLLANHNFLKKKKNNYNINDEIFSLLKKKYPQITIRKKDYLFIFEKIEILLINFEINNILNEIILKVEEDG